MSLLSKMKQKGISGLWDAIAWRIFRPINRFVYHWYAKQNLQQDLIVLESEGDFCDNAYALYDHMLQNGYLKHYRVCWLVDHPDNPKFKGYINTSFLSKVTDRLNPALMKVLSTCRYYIYDHNCLYDYLGLEKRPEQIVAYLTHGAGFKASKGAPADRKPSFDVMFATGSMPADILANFWNYPTEKVINAGYPRLDYFFATSTDTQQKVRDTLNLDRYHKVIVWMPTFRQCNNKSISEEYIQNETGLPLLGTKAELESLSRFLQEKNILLILKVHHLQAALPIFREQFQNILILQDPQLQNMGIQLYQFLSQTDALITDYSSISVEYMLLDHPIIYTLDDYDAYAKSRGFYPSDPIQYMKGHHVYNTEALCQAIDQIASEEDPYKAQRAEILEKLFAHPDGNASNRILKHLGIQK